MVKYYKPEDVQIEVGGSNTAYFPQWIGRDIVAFGRTAAFPMYITDWTWDKDTAIMQLNAFQDIFHDGERFHAEFATITDAPQEYTDVTAVGGNLMQYPHILKYDLSDWSNENGDFVHIERRCRCRFTTKADVQFNGTVAKAVIYLPLPEITIKEGVNVTVYDGDKVYESGMVLQYRKNALNFNQRLWL